MYKSRLQELCQQKGWNLPEYSSTKEGPNHNPRFKTTVTVNGVSFSTLHQCKSIKESQKEAAMLAFNHFISPQPPPQPSPLFDFPQPVLPPGNSDFHSSAGFSSESSKLDSIPAAGEGLLPNMTETFQTPQANNNASGVKDNKGFIDIQHLYKNQLQNYAQKRSLPLPMYSNESEGPPHACRFKSKVTIDGQIYESPNFFSTVKDAEHAAAKVALMSLLPHGGQEDDPVLYKNLLQELAQKEGFCLPMYNTKHSGLSHNPTFISTVEIEGDTFQGEVAKTKKQAEMNAAKVAYIGLKERKIPSPGCLLPGASSPSLQSTTTVALQEKARHKVHVTMNSNIIPIERTEADRAVDQEASRMMPVNVEVSTHHAPIPSPKPDTNMTRKRDILSSEVVYPSRMMPDDVKVSPHHAPIPAPKPDANMTRKRDIPSSEVVYPSRMMPDDVEVSHHHAPIPSPKPDAKMTRKRDLPSSDVVYAPIPSPKSDANMMRKGDLPSSEVEYSRLRDPFPSAPSSPEGGSSSASTPSECPSDLVSDSNIEQLAGTNTLRRTKVCVYPHSQDAKLHAGLILFSDDKWVAVRSDPSQKSS